AWPSDFPTATDLSNPGPLDSTDPVCCWHLRCNKWPGVLPLSLAALGDTGEE
ncbi:mCG1035514, partial [Mus musculus]